LRARRSARPRSSSPSPRDRRARPIMPAASGPAMRRSAPTAIRARLPARTADAHPSVSQPGCRCSGSAATTSPRLPRLLQSASPPSGNFRRRLPPQPHAHEGPRNRVVQSSMLAPSPSQHLESQISRPGNPPGDSPKPNHALEAQREFQREAEPRRADHAEEHAAPREEDKRERREEHDPRNEPGQRLARDVEGDREHQPDRGRSEAADEALDRAPGPHLLVDFQHRQDQIARHLDGDHRGAGAEYAIDHIADRGEVEIVLPRRHAAQRIGIEKLVEVEEAVLHESVLQQREQRRAIAEGEKIIGENDEEELRQAHRPGYSWPRSRNAPAIPPPRMTSAGLTLGRAARMPVITASTRSSEGRKIGRPRRTAETTMMPSAAGSRVASI